MNKELKRILNYLKECSEESTLTDTYDFYFEDVKILYDYITDLQQYYKDNVNKYEELIEKYSNLQQELEIMIKDDERSQETIIRLTEENERLKASIDWWKDRFFGQQEFDDSHRIVAVEYKKRIDKAISKINDLYSYADNEEYVDNYCKDLLNILQNGSENNEYRT